MEIARKKEVAWRRSRKEARKWRRKFERESSFISLRSVLGQPSETSEFQWHVRSLATELFEQKKKKGGLALGTTGLG